MLTQTIAAVHPDRVGVDATPEAVTKAKEQTQLWQRRRERFRAAMKK